MVELLVQDLRPEFEAYADFGAYRRAEERRLGRRASIDREAWLAGRRQQLQARMRRRRRARGRSGGDGGQARSPFSLFWEATRMRHAVSHHGTSRVVQPATAESEDPRAL